MMWGLLKPKSVTAFVLSTSALFVVNLDASAHPETTAIDMLGGMDSGGAGLYGSDMNPWFLENAPNVTYCLDLDPNTFHQNIQMVDHLILKAVDSWRSVFAESEKKDPVFVGKSGILKIATQKFTRVPCSDNVDVRFQLGKLTEDQKKKLGNYRQWIGATYRTSYDFQKMRGKGFIYIAADSGPDKPISKDLVTDVWKQCSGCLLQRTIVHELGHVFGFGHIGNDWDIMSERHLEKVTSQEWFNKHLVRSEDQAMFMDRSTLQGYLSFPQRYSAKDCTTLADRAHQSRLRAIFDIPDNENCFAFVRDRSSMCAKEATLFKFGNDSYNRYFVASECKVAGGRSEVAWLYLPPGQTYFSFLEGETVPVKLPIAVAYERTICSGLVYERSGNRTPVAMSIMTSRDGVFAGTAFEPNAELPEIFSSSME